MSPKKTSPVEPTKSESLVNNIVKPGFNWKSLYLYLVSLITLLIAVFSIVSMLRNGVALFYPSPAYLNTYAPTVAGSALAQANQDAIARHSSLLGIVDGFCGFLVASPLYWYHWRLARKSE